MPRKKDWPSHGKKISEAKVVKLDANKKFESEEDVAQGLAWIFQWARDMHAWGQDVRDDILRLEGHAGFASGDPGDPPDPPPNGED